MRVLVMRGGCTLDGAEMLFNLTRNIYNSA